MDRRIQVCTLVLCMVALIISEFEFNVRYHLLNAFVNKIFQGLPGGSWGEDSGKPVG